MNDIYETRDHLREHADVSSICVIQGVPKRPLISILIPTYQRAETLADTLDSALAQITGSEYEVVIVSNDPEGEHSETQAVIESRGDDRVSYYVNQKNIGLCGNWNRGLELCSAPYVSMIHDDDVLSPWFVASVLKAIEANDEPLIVGVRSVTFTSTEKPEFVEQDELRYRAVTKRSFFFGRYLTIAGMTVNRDAAIALGGYGEEYYPNEDTIFIYQALLHGQAINVENDLAGYRKELNLSLSKGTMRQIVEMTEHTRRAIAHREGFARLFMRLFDREYLYSYAVGANRYWGTDVDVDEIMQEFGFSKGKPNRIRLKMMDLITKLGRL